MNNLEYAATEIIGWKGPHLGYYYESHGGKEIYTKHVDNWNPDSDHSQLEQVEKIVGHSWSLHYCSETKMFTACRPHDKDSAIFNESGIAARFDLAVALHKAAIIALQEEAMKKDVVIKAMEQEDLQKEQLDDL